MSRESEHNRDALADRIRASLKKAEAHASRLKRTNTRLLILGVVNSGASTLITGVTAGQGPIVGEGIPGWRLSCIAGAVLGFITTVSVGLTQQLNFGDRLSEANECRGRLKFLDLAIETGGRSRDEIMKEYEAILKAYPDVAA